jgi:hypothetical protein
MVAARAIVIRPAFVRRVLDGAVTAMVSIVESRPAPCVDAAGGPAWEWHHKNGRANRIYGPATPDYQWPDGMLQFSPFGAIGSSLWVREEFSYVYNPQDSDEASLAVAAGEGTATVRYRADPAQERREWMPAELMPQWASRAVLKITALAVVQLGTVTDDITQRAGFADRDAFVAHWNATHRRPNTWDDALWCWQLQFKIRRVARRRIAQEG